MLRYVYKFALLFLFINVNAQYGKQVVSHSTAAIKSIVLKTYSYSTSDKSKRTLIYKNKLVYNHSSNIVEEVRFQLSSGQFLIDSTVYKYNKEEKLTERETYERNQLKLKTVYRYNEASKPSEILYYYEGQPGGKELLSYEKSGNKTGSVHYEKDGKMEYFCAFINNTEGQITEEIKYRKDSSLWVKINYSYDERGNKIKEASDNRYYKSTSLGLWEFDTKGNQTSYKQFFDGKLSSETHEVYDKNGDLITYGYLASPEKAPVKKIFKNYKCNAKGDWIQRIQFNTAGDPIALEERIIDYY